MAANHSRKQQLRDEARQDNRHELPADGEGTNPALRLAASSLDASGFGWHRQRPEEVNVDIPDWQPRD